MYADHITLHYSFVNRFWLETSYQSRHTILHDSLICGRPVARIGLKGGGGCPGQAANPEGAKNKIGRTKTLQKKERRKQKEGFLPYPKTTDGGGAELGMGGAEPLDPLPSTGLCD